MNKRLLFACEKDEALFVLECLRSIDKMIKDAEAVQPRITELVMLSGMVVLSPSRRMELQARIDKAVREQCD